MINRSLSIKAPPEYKNKKTAFKKKKYRSVYKPDLRNIFTSVTGARYKISGGSWRKI